MKKPFSLKELAARLAALLRRGGVAGAERAVADLRLDVATHTVHRAGVRRPVTPSGLRLLDLLMRSSPAVVTRDQMIELLWGAAPPSSDAALRAHVHLLRQAVDARGLPRLLHTVLGVGYRVAEEPDAA